MCMVSSLAVGGVNRLETLFYLQSTGCSVFAQCHQRHPIDGTVQFLHDTLTDYLVGVHFDSLFHNIRFSNNG